MTDYELVYKKDYFELWKKYEGLMMIYFKKLPEDVRDYVFEDFADFKSSCYPVLIKAVEALNLSKIKNKETWTFWQHFSYYLTNYTTRQCVRDTYKLWNSERQETIPDEINRYKSSEDHHEYNMLIKSFTDDELQIVTQRISGLSWAVIYKQFGGRKKVEELRSKIEKKVLDYI